MNAGNVAMKKSRSSFLNRRSKGEKAFDIFNIILMSILLLVVLYPIWYGIIYAFDSAQDASKGTIMFWPAQPTFINFTTFLKDPQILWAFLVTASRTVIGTVTSVFFTAMVSYGLSKKDLFGRKTVMMIGLVTMVFYAGMIPGYFVIRSLGMLNTFWVYIIPGLYSFYNTLIFITFFRGIHQSLEESAQIDGANDMRIFLTIIIPLSMPVIATIALFNGVAAYNDYFTTVLYVSSDHSHLFTIQYYLYQIIDLNQVQAIARNMPASMRAVLAAKTSPISLKYAAMVITAFPIMCAYPFLQKYFVKGVMIGSIKE